MAFLFHSLLRASLTAMLGLLALSPATVRAEPPKVYLWGFQRGCEQLPDVARKVEKRLFGERGDVALLGSPSGKPAPACLPGSGTKCAQSLRAACPLVQGRVLGGQVATDREVLSVRLWLYDLATGQIAYQDDYCQSCDMVNALSVQARHLIDQPRFGNTPGAKPMYCSADAAPAAAAGPQGPVFLSVFGDGKHKPAIAAALKQQLTLRGRPLPPMPYEPRSYGPEDMQKIVGTQQDAQVLGAESRREGNIYLFLYDARAQRTIDKMVECEGCNKDALIARLQTEAATLLEQCFGHQCGDAGSRPGTPPPVEACEPLPEPVCEGPAAPTSAAATGRMIDPSTAMLVKGGLWGLFAASAAASIGLFAANPLVSVERDGQTYRGTLTQPAWSMAAVAAASLAIAIPTTIVVNRATVRAPTAAAGSPAIQCP